MHPTRVLLSAACAALLATLALAPDPATAHRSAAGSECTGGAGLKVNRWIGQHAAGQVGLWDNDDNWSRGRYPRAGSKRQVVCIRTAGQVLMFQGSGLKVHVAALVLRGGGDLVVQSSNSLFVDADPHRLISTIAPTSRLEVAGGMVGGHGRIEVQGELAFTKGNGKINKLTTRPCERDCTDPLRGRFGTVSVEEGGRLDVDDARVRATDGYHVVVIGGELRMLGHHGQVTADGGTRLGLRNDSALTFENNGGWYAGPRKRFFDGQTRVQIHGGVVAKEAGSGTSSVQGTVGAMEGLNATVATGTLAVAGTDPADIHTDLAGGSAYSTGACLPEVDTYGCKPVATEADVQIASVALPEAVDADKVTVTELGSDSDTLRPTAFRGDLGKVPKSDPVVIELRIDASAVGGRTPATTVVAVSEKKGAPYVDVPDCSAGTIPTGATACVDRDVAAPDASRFVDGDLVMVVRTQHFSRYICR